MNSRHHLHMFQDKINSKKPFSVIRPADGEYHILNRLSVHAIDKWTPNENVIRDLYDSIHKASLQSNMYIGIPCPDCQGRYMYEYYMKNFNIKNVTYANVFNNFQWKIFLKSIPKFYYIGPGTNENERVIDRFIIDELLTNTWDASTFLPVLEEWVRERTGLFLVSAGPLAKIIIPYLHERHTKNQYLDVGSALDNLLKKNPNTRSYTLPDSYESKLICSHDIGHTFQWYYFYTPDYDCWNRHLQNTLRDFFHIQPILLHTIDGLHEIHHCHHWTGCSKKIQLLVDCIRKNIGHRIVFSDATLYVNPQKVKELYKLVRDAPNGMTFMRNDSTDEINLCFISIDCTLDVLHTWETILGMIGPNDRDQYIASKVIHNPHFFEASKCVAQWPVDIALWNSRHRESFLVLKIFTQTNESKSVRDAFRLAVMNYYGYHIDKEITCILTYYKRPHCFYEQLDAIQKQTIPPTKIIVWVNGVDFYPSDIEGVTVVNASENFGVWARFTVALMAKTDYVCVFDDDTIPGLKWFENCIETIEKVNGLLGTIGVIFKNSMDTYQIDTRWGWDNPNEDVKKVDIVGHSWFFRRQWLQYLWKYYEPDNMFIVGEDIAFSCALQKEGIGTFVPPHPPNNIDMFGSKPDKAWLYGTEDVAISHQHSTSEKFNRAFEIFRKKHSFDIIRDVSFTGGWSYTQKEMNELFKYTKPGLKILEFGAGDSTAKIYKLLHPSLYYVYETDKKYIPINDFIKVFIYEDVESTVLDHGELTFDLVLIDGPNGETRKYWFSKIQKCVHSGTILLVDDFNHYKSFGEELDRCFEYEVLSFSDEPFVEYGEHSWKIVRITSIKAV